MTRKILDSYNDTKLFSQLLFCDASIDTYFVPILLKTIQCLSGDETCVFLSLFDRVIKEAVTANKLQKAFFALEPFLRKVVGRDL